MMNQIILFFIGFFPGCPKGKGNKATTKKKNYLDTLPYTFQSVVTESTVSQCVGVVP